MFSGYLYPVYRNWGWGYPYGAGYPMWNYGGYGYGYGGYGSNIIGSAVANQSLINTGTVTGVNQIATPTVIW